jgi:hypothetical protein
MQFNKLMHRTTPALVPRHVAAGDHYVADINNKKQVSYTPIFCRYCKHIKNKPLVQPKYR